MAIPEELIVADRSEAVNLFDESETTSYFAPQNNAVVCYFGGAKYYFENFTTSPRSRRFEREAVHDY